MEFSMGSLLASMLVSSIGFLLFVYGRKLGRPAQLLAGIVLLIFPYFVSGVWLMFGIAAAVLLLMCVAIAKGG